MTPLEKLLADLERLEKDATPGPWTTEQNPMWDGTQIPQLTSYIEGCVGRTDLGCKNEAELIVLMRNNATLLVSALRECIAALEVIERRPDLPNPEKDADWKNCMKWSSKGARACLDKISKLGGEG